MQDLLYAKIGATFSIAPTIHSQGIEFDKVEFVCNDLNIKRELSKLENNLYYTEFTPSETSNFKCGYYTATLYFYVEDKTILKDYSLYVDYNVNKGDI